MDNYESKSHSNICGSSPRQRLFRRSQTQGLAAPIRKPHSSLPLQFQTELMSETNGDLEKDSSLALAEKSGVVGLSGEEGSAALTVPIERRRWSFLEWNRLGIIVTSHTHPNSRISSVFPSQPCKHCSSGTQNQQYSAY